MQIEVDQSGKIEQTNLDTVVAFSNDEQYAILLTKKIKRELLQSCKGKFGGKLILQIFVAMVYLTIRNYLRKDLLVIIDNEYEGKQNLIKSLLLGHIKKGFQEFDRNLIRIHNITKKSRAHFVAVNVQRKKIKPQKIVTLKEILDTIRGARKSNPASTAFSHKARRGLAWHPSSKLRKEEDYIKLSKGDDKTSCSKKEVGECM